MARSAEKLLGEVWAGLERERGSWVQKLDATNNTGLPDWLLVDRSGVALVEAKLAMARGRYAYTPKQLRAAQRFTLNQVALRKGRALVLLLDHTGYTLLTESRWTRALTRSEYLRLRRPWPDRR